MKFPFSFKTSDVKNIAAPKGKDISMQDMDRIIRDITYEALFAEKQKLSDWVNARNLALDYSQPNWADLIRVYDDMIRDLHVKSIISTIKNKLKQRPFQIKNGETDNQILKEIFTNKWYHSLIDIFVDAQFYPYSVIELGNFNTVTGFYEMKQVKREYICPQYGQIKKSMNDSPSKVGNTQMNGNGLYKGEQLVPFFVEILSADELGFMDSAIPWISSKKSALQSWQRYSEMFGQPFRQGKTDIRDNVRRTNMVNMMKAWGESGWGVFDNSDAIDLIANAGGDSFNVFEKLMKFANNEISKAFAGAVGVLDEKSFVGSSEAGERLMNEYVNSFAIQFEFFLNAEILPRIYNSYKFDKDGNKFSFVVSDTTKLKGQENLKGTVGGVQGLIALIGSVSQGLLNPEGFIPIAAELYGFDDNTIKIITDNINKGVVLGETLPGKTETSKNTIEKTTAILKTDHGKRLVGFSNMEQIDNYYKEILK